MSELPIPPPVTNNPDAMTKQVSKKVKACTLCRQQKLKCDAIKRGSPCSRCAKNRVACYFSPNFERQKARTKAELQHEIDVLRKRIEFSPSAENSNSIVSFQELEPVVSTSIPSPRVSMRQMSPIDNIAGDASNISTGAPNITSSSLLQSTSARSLNGVYVESFKIDDCFALFFEHYHPNVPILDPTCDPNTFYKMSPFVFWCVLVTGSRRYELDPTLLDRLAPNLSQLALKSMSQIMKYFSTIVGLVLLCAWPLPMKTMFDDPSPMYSGAMMQLALQNSLHMSMKRQDGRLIASKESVHEAYRLRVWAYLQYVAYSTSWTTGSSPHLITDAFDCEVRGGETFRTLSPSIYWMQKYVKTVARAIISLTDMVAVNSSNHVLSPLIKIWDERILEISQTALDDMHPVTPVPTDGSPGSEIRVPNPLVLAFARVYVKAYHFFGNDPSIQLPALMELNELACRWMEQACAMDQTSAWASYCSESYSRFIALAATIILRIAHSHQLKSKIDLRRCQHLFFAAVKLLRKRSLQSGDINASTATALSELWYSDSCFKRQDGTHDSLHVRVCGKGVMGILYDCLWSSRRSSHQVDLDRANSQNHKHLPNISPNFEEGVVDDGSFDVPMIEDEYSSTLIDDSSLNFLTDGANWTNEDLFWM